MPAGPILVEAKNSAPAKYGLLETVPPEALPPHGGMAGVEYDSEFCGLVNAWTAPCVDPGAATKTESDGIDTVTGVPVPLYHLFTCRLVGSPSPGEVEARAIRSLEANQSRAFAAAFGASLGSVATVIGGAPVGVIEGLGLLEQNLGEIYGGQRYIHVPLDVATAMFSQFLIKQVGDHLETNLGSIVIADPGYAYLSAGGDPAPAGSSWIFATGQVRTWESAITTTGLTLSSPYDNEFKALAERTVVGTHECRTYALTVTLEA